QDEHRGALRDPVHLRLEPVPVAPPGHDRRVDVDGGHEHQADRADGGCRGGVESGDGDGCPGHGAADRHRRADAALVHQGPDRDREMSRGPGARLGMVVALGAALLSGGCPLDMPKTAAEKEAEAVPQPEWRLGDRWSFKRTTLTGTSSVVTHQVIAATMDSYTVKVLGLGGDVTRQWTPEFHLVQEHFADGTTAR